MRAKAADAWAKEEKMEKFSDLNQKARNGCLVLVQSKSTLGWWKDGPPKKKSEETFKKLSKDIVSLEDLVHVGTIHYNNTSVKGMIVDGWLGCGGNLKFSSEKMRSGELHSWPYMGLGQRAGAQTHLYCFNGRCNMHLTSYETLPELQNLMLHLALKQMVPELKTCNFLDYRDQITLFDATDWGIGKLGVIAFKGEIFKGIISGKQSEDLFLHLKTQLFGYESQGWGMAFMLMPGMATTSGFDGLDQWFKFLLLEKFEQLETLSERLAEFFIGPKPTSGRR
jgi:hypothetical protein